MYDKVVWFNPYGVGDVFESREFVRECMKIIPAKEYFYAHNKPPRMLIDIDNLQYTPITDKMNVGISHTVEDNCLYISTWIGQKGLKYGCTVESIFEMNNEILLELGFEPLKGIPLEYLTTIDYTKFQIQGVDAFVEKCTGDKILICNGDVLSGQAANFNFVQTINFLSLRYPQKTFILTNKFKTDLTNVFFTGDITKTTDGFDINEISYLSTFCGVIAGRYSGPHTCSQVKQNWFDPNKRLVTFTYREPGCSFTHSKDVLMRQFWSNAIHPKLVADKISEAIESR
jgi:hypothetical protein